MKCLSIMYFAKNQYTRWVSVMKINLVFMLMFTHLSLHIFFGTTTIADTTKSHLPEGAIARLGKRTINDIAYSPDGKHLAVASDIGVWIYDAQTGSEQALIPATRVKAFWRMAFSPNGHTLAVIRDRREIQLWDYRSQTLKGSLAERGYYPSKVVFSPDGHTMASTDTDQLTQLWDVITMKFKCTLEGSHDTQDNEGMEYFNVAYSPDGKAFAIGAGDGTIRLWDTTTGKLMHTFIGNIRSAGSFCFSPDGKTIASRSFTNTVWLWDTTTGRHKNTFEYDVNGENIAYRPDGETIAIIRYGNIHLLDATTGKEKSRFEIGVENSFTFSPDGTTIAALIQDGTVQVWGTQGGIPIIYGFEEETRVKLEVPIETGKHKYTFKCVDSVVRILFSPDGDTLTTLCSNNTAQVWNTETGELKYTIDHTSSIN